MSGHHKSAAKGSAAPALDTVAVHAGRDDFRQLGVHAPPLDLSTTYPVGDLAQAVHDIDALIAGGRASTNAIYSRLANPTVDRFERAFAELERAEDAVSFGSGMAAITALLLAVKQAGGHVVGVRPLYGGTDHLLESRLLGLDVTWATPRTVGDAIRPDTALVMIETPANPTLALVDIADVARQAGRVPVAVDSTFATPVLQLPIALGAAFSVHSATKYIGGHGDVMAGVIATSSKWAGVLRQVRILTGGVLHPMGAYMLHRGLQTLPLRVRAAQDGAREVALHLTRHRAVERVFYPALPGCDPTGLVGRQMRGPGAMLSFEVRGGFDAASAVLASVQMITPAVSLGSADTLIEHPAGLTHRVIGQAARDESGVTPGMLRLSMGLESARDVWRDLAHALDAAWPADAHAPAPARKQELAGAR
ncbi:MAG TPA: aminotransferase class I/II-fold pyridoxal phosphate-dependent enzyme [Gemmatimonadaceae bacterium]|nr:aminotransferase class I/II-fold pyridoxal phosphate-dependent enzyme [Gemmatimonadaceae bacterium]